MPRREPRGGDETRARVWHPAGARCEPPVASDGRKNDGHKYRSYLCFMTCSGSSWRRQNPEAKLQLSTARILTDVLAQWIRRSSSAFLPPPPPPPANTVAALFQTVIHAILLDNSASLRLSIEFHLIRRSDFERAFFAINNLPRRISHHSKISCCFEYDSTSNIYIFHPLEVKEMRGNDLISRRGSR